MKNNILITIILFLTFSVNAQSLEDYLKEATKNSPELKSKNYSYLSAVEKVNEVGSLPNTTIKAGYFVQEAETRVGAQKAKLSVSQMMPWFGTLEAKKESASFMSDAKLNSIDLAKRKLDLNVKTSFYQLYELKETSSILKENLTILKTLEKLALNELENNRSSMVAVLKIKMEINSLNDKISTVSEKFNAKKIGFNLLLNRDENLDINILDSLIIGETDQLWDKNDIQQNPELLQLDNLNSALKKSELATKKAGLPTIGIGLDYVFVENRAVENLMDNGKDIVMPMVTVSVPLFSKKFNSKQKQLKLEQKAIETTKVATTNQLFTLYEKTMANLINAKVSVKTQSANINQANQAEKVLMAAYQTAKMDFEQLLEVQQLKLKFQLKKINALKEFALQKSMLEFLTKNNE